ncbi:RHS repeat domain-containing protein [Rodentibacter caecimuris]|uniref:RHS repeat domain-containing protein n=1 Tax=Rodentibacter caecimuris TaxID=1796644 RepID=UPI00211A6EDD|nr:RHS repeat-associated core domain-containing protein [Rodentibacter heylii]MCQ9124042.1 RHS domain-containing protein [Rodentibacter heylii]
MTKGGEKQLHSEFIWDGSHLVQEIRHEQSAQNAPKTNRTFTYIYRHPNSYEPLAQCLARTDGQGNRIEHEINYFHCDQIGIPREMTDSDGKLIWRGRYDAWGGLIRERHPNNAAGTHQPFRLQNQYSDEETGLHYNFLRYYDPITGRFTTQDPIGLQGGMNLYRFEGTVQNQTDPLGLFAPALAPAVPWILEGLAYVGTAVAGILIAAGIMDAKEEHDKAQSAAQAETSKCKKDPCSDYPTRSEAKKQALASSQLTENDLIAKRGIQGWEQYAYSAYPQGDIKIVSHHPSDRDHPCPHWHISNAKTDNGEIQTFSHGAWKYQGGGAVFPHRFN